MRRTAARRTLSNLLKDFNHTDAICDTSRRIRPLPNFSKTSVFTGASSDTSRGIRLRVTEMRRTAHVVAFRSASVALLQLSFDVCSALILRLCDAHSAPSQRFDGFPSAFIAPLQRSFDACLGLILRLCDFHSAPSHRHRNAFAAPS